MLKMSLIDAIAQLMDVVVGDGLEQVTSASGLPSQHANINTKCGKT